MTFSPNRFYKDKPVFGLDIGFSSMKAMQIDWTNKEPVVCGYGVHRFDSDTVQNGVIVDPESLAKSAYELFDRSIVGSISSRRVAIAIPAARTFGRPLTLPKLEEKDLAEAVRLEAEQYIPVPIDELYIDYAVTRKGERDMDVFAVAVPKKIVDSYMLFGRLLGLEPVVLETTIAAAARLFVHSEQSDIPTILIDFGSISTDITVYDRTLVVTGNVPGGGDSFTSVIAQALGVTKEEGLIIKTKYGIGVSKKQAEIVAALSPMLNDMVKEIQRVIRYYEERGDNKKKISQIVTMGGGANMPGLSEFLTNNLRLPVRTCDPWQHLTFKGLQPPSAAEKSMYVTVSGLALLKPKEIFA